MLQFLLQILLKHIILAVHHHFHWLLVATKLLTTQLHALNVNESDVGNFTSDELSTLRKTALRVTVLTWRCWRRCCIDSAVPRPSMGACTPRRTLAYL